MQGPRPVCPSHLERLWLDAEGSARLAEEEGGCCGGNGTGRTYRDDSIQLLRWALYVVALTYAGSGLPDVLNLRGALGELV
jgi:hypothetical protein